MPDIICRNCSGRYHETTDQFDPDKSPHGGMFRLKDKYKANGWEAFPEHSGVTGDAIECPDCGGPYQDITNRVKVDDVGAQRLAKTMVGQLNDAGAAVNDSPFDVPFAMTGDPEAQLLRLSDEGKTPTEIGGIVGKSPQWVGIHTKRLRG